jgi:hypothetical protein
MAYYPKSQVKTNLYTNGDEYTTSPSTSSPSISGYTGYYFKTSTGKLFTGKNPSDIPNKQLYSLSTPPVTDYNDATPPSNVISYNQSAFDSTYSNTNGTNASQTRIIPQFSLTLPSPEDKKRGFLIRYFCKKNNELIYFETSQADHDRIKSQDPTTAYDLYSVASLKWYITGDPSQVTSQNITQINQAASSNGWLGFIQYFKGDFNRYLGT